MLQGSGQGLSPPACASRLRLLPCTASHGRHGHSRGGRCGHPGPWQACRSSPWPFCLRLPLRPARAVLRRCTRPLRRQGAGRACLDKPGHKMPLAALTGPDAAHLAHIQRQAAGAVGFALAAKGVVHISQGIRKGELRVALQECRHLSLVLLRGKGAGGINQLPARGQHGGCTVQNFCTQLSTLLHQRFTMLLTSHRLLAEHSLAGTGRIHQNTVKKLRQRASAMRAGDSLSTTALDTPMRSRLLFQDIRTGRNIFVAHQHPGPPAPPPAGCFCRRGRRTYPTRASRAARPAAGLPRTPTAPASRTRPHGGTDAARALNRPADAPQMPPCKGRCFQRKICLCGKLLRRSAQGRHRHAALSRLLRGGIQDIEPLSQQGALPLLKNIP